jgi:hypothetical protein
VFACPSALVAAALAVLAWASADVAAAEAIWMRLANSADAETTLADTVFAWPSALVAAAEAIWINDASSAEAETTLAETVFA